MKSGQVHMDGSVEDVFERAGELAEAGILLPRISLLSRELRGHIPLEKTAVSPAGLAEMLVSSVVHKPVPHYT